MSIPAKLLITVATLPVLAFSVFGFLASFEPGGGIGWKVGYAAVALATLSAAIGPWVASGKSDR